MASIIIIGFLLPNVLFIVKISVLIWVFYKTRRLAAIIYLIYFSIDWLFYSELTKKIVDRIRSDGTILWLGETSELQAVNFMLLARFIPSIIETILFVWLLKSLTRRSS
jgi:hypothetical protein